MKDDGPGSAPEGLPSFMIGQLARSAGVKADTVRFYERIGLLDEPERTFSGYRIYDPAAVQRLQFIKKAQALGFTLEEIKRILRLRGRGRETCACVIRMAEASLGDVEAKLGELQAFRDDLARNLARWRRMSGQGAPLVAEFCALIEKSRPHPRVGSREARPSGNVRAIKTSHRKTSTEKIP